MQTSFSKSFDTSSQAESKSTDVSLDPPSGLIVDVWRVHLPSMPRCMEDTPETPQRRTQSATHKFQLGLPDSAAYCKCLRKSQKPRRHWATACPWNPDRDKAGFRCDTCQITFGRKDNLKRHLRDVHKEKRLAKGNREQRSEGSGGCGASASTEVCGSGTER